MAVWYTVNMEDPKENLTINGCTCFASILHDDWISNRKSKPVSITYWPRPSRLIKDPDLYLHLLGKLFPECRELTILDLEREGITVNANKPGAYINHLFKMIRLMHELPGVINTITYLDRGLEINGRYVRIPLPIAFQIGMNIKRYGSKYSKISAREYGSHVHSYYHNNIYSAEAAKNLHKTSEYFSARQHSFKRSKKLRSNTQGWQQRIYKNFADDKRITAPTELVAPTSSDNNDCGIGNGLYLKQKLREDDVLRHIQEVIKYFYSKESTRAMLEQVNDRHILQQIFPEENRNAA